MTLQSPNVLPPPGPKPDFEAMAKKAFSERVENQWITVPEQTFTIGFEDPESDDGPNRFFAWDNEREPYSVTAPEVEAHARPVCNEEYAAYLFATGNKTIPTTWTQTPNASPRTSQNNWLTVKNNGVAFKKFVDSLAIKTVYGPVDLALALDWPLMSSYNEAEGYAIWAKARIPTLHEVRSIHEYAEKQKAKRNPPSERLHPDPEEMFVDLTGCNVGFQNFHPTPVTQNGGRISGLGDMGGAWEWTSSLFAPQPNFKPMDIYPGYSGMYISPKRTIRES
jgi:formylglycine-generating enzyme required for sulfatase activity